MNSALLRFGAFLVFLHLAACGGDDKSTDNTPQPDLFADTTPDLVGDTTTDTAPNPDLDTTVPDLAEDHTQPDTNKPDAQDVQPGTCEPACDPAAGQYCDAATSTCKTVECTACVRDLDCGPQGICANFQQAGIALSFCSNSCTTGADCEGGFACTDGICIPEATCPAKVCQSEGALGDACPFEGIHEDCAACGQDLVCAAESLNVECIFDSDCYEAGLSSYYNPQCKEGKCAYSYCTGKCDANGQCPTGFGPMVSGFSCWCVPVGTTPAGEACPFDSVNTNADDCGAGMVCLGIAPTEESAACTTDLDCVDAYFDVTSQCVEGRCGLSFCSPKCTKGTCEEGFAPISVSNACYCAPVYVGDVEPGKPCTSGEVYPEAGNCQSGSTCIAIEGEVGGDTCTTSADCPLSIWYANPACVDGVCQSAFCSPYCDTEGKCPAGYDPAPSGVTCICLPEEVGEAGPGEGCAMWIINSDLDFCQADLACLAFTDTENAPECVTAEDCDPSAFVGVRDCVEGKCSASFCSPKCDAESGCEVGYNPISVGENDDCYCAPKYVGTADVDEACRAGNINSESSGCLANLTCLSMSSIEEVTTPCTTTADCPNDYLGVKDCVDGLCASSFCAAPCEGTTCTMGYVPSEFDPCLCLPEPPVGP